MGQQGNITNENQNYNIDQTGVTLGDNTQISLGDNSIITNEGEDFRLDAQGLTLATPDGTPEDQKSIIFEKSGYDDAKIGSYFTGVIPGIAIDYQADAHYFSTGNQSSSLDLTPGLVRAHKPVKLPAYTTGTRPDPSEYPEGSIIYNRSTGSINYVNSQNEWEATK